MSTPESQPHQPTERQLALAHFHDNPTVQNLKTSLDVEDLLDIWEALSNWVEEAEDLDPDDAFAPEELEEAQRTRALNARMEALMNHFHAALKIIPQDLRS